jgi:exonuclease III
VLAGDLNAVRAADYPPERWRDIVARRAAYGREAPSVDVVHALDARGFVDCARGRPAHEGPLAPLPEALQQTCWVGTRVDMVWLDAAAHAAFACTEVRVVETDVSDHRPVVVELVARDG